MNTNPTREMIKAFKTNISQYEKEARMLANVLKMAPAVRERKAEIRNRLREEIVALES